MTMDQPVKESIQLVTTPTNRPKSVLMDNQKTKFEEFIFNVHNMSPIRFIMFILSISLCFITIIVVLIVVPCEWSKCISTKKDKLLWSRSVFKDMELYGNPSIIESNQKLSQMVFLVRGSILNSQNVPPRTERFPSDGGGLLQIDTTMVTEMWHKRINPLPDKIDCKLLNNELKKNSDVYCIVGTSNGNLLGVISSKHKGEFIWKHTKGGLESNTTKLYNKNDIIYMEFPVIIPDCNSDGVNEMAFIQQKNNVSTLAIVSGKSGKDMINNINNNNCTKMTDLILKYDMTLVYYCRTNSGTDPIETVPIKTMLNCTGDWIPDSIHQIERKHDQGDENQFPLEHYCLNVINSHYNCPTKCKVVMNVTNNFGETVWSTNIDRAYVMKPVTLELRNNISGFVIKLWRWDNVTDENNMKLVKVENIHEEIIVIVYNSSRVEDFHVKTICLNKILQVCTNETSCQPKLEYQKYSLNVFDINNDGYRELVSVFVTFEHINSLSKYSVNDKHSLQLISKINVFELESQLIQDFENGIFV